MRRAIRAVEGFIPDRTRKAIDQWKMKYGHWPPVGYVRLGSLKRVKPISGVFGFDRGSPIDRYYVDSFLSRNQESIRGRCLEVGEDAYTGRFGQNRVASMDILNVQEGYAGTTILADLTVPGSLPEARFDCIIATQTLNVIFDYATVLQNLYSALVPGGVLLATFPGISQISRYDMDRWGDYWRFTSRSTELVFGEVFGADRVEISTYGNVLAAVSFLHGLAAEELKVRDLDYRDADYEVSICVKAVKREK